MSADSERLPPPNEPAAFESLCLDLWKDIWGDSGAQKNGRSGQPQAGVDVFGQQLGRSIGVQCKQKDGLLRTMLTTAELEDEVKKAVHFAPRLRSFILATSGPRDGKVQERARQLTHSHKRRGLFTVRVWSWEDIWHEIYQRETLFRRILPIYWPRIAALGAPVQLELIHIQQRSLLKGMSLTAWPRFLEIDSNYPERRTRLLRSILNGEYEEADKQYWELLYYTGTRELWTDRDFISQRLLELSDKNKDYRTSGLILARGQAWPLMYKGSFQRAKQLLAESRESFVRARAHMELGVFHEYMGDIYSETGDINLANDCYIESIDYLRDDDAHEAELKRLFMHSRYLDLGSRKRIAGLVRLRDSFRSIKSYREGIVQMELAKSYRFLNSREALITAKEAYSLLKDDVRMPTTAARAKKLLEFIRRGTPMIGKTI